MQKLIDIGVKKDEIKVTSVGNYSRNLGKDFLKGKTFELHLKDFALIDKNIKTKSIFTESII